MVQISFFGGIVAQEKTRSTERVFRFRMFSPHLATVFRRALSTRMSTSAPVTVARALASRTSAWSNSFFNFVSSSGVSLPRERVAGTSTVPLFMVWTGRAGLIVNMGGERRQRPVPLTVSNALGGQPQWRAPTENAGASLPQKRERQKCRSLPIRQNEVSYSRTHRRETKAPCSASGLQSGPRPAACDCGGVRRLPSGSSSDPHLARGAPARH